MLVLVILVNHLLIQVKSTIAAFLTIRSSKQDVRREGSLGFYGKRIPRFHTRHHPAAPRFRSRCAEPGGLGLLEHLEPIHPQLHAWSCEE